MRQLRWFYFKEEDGKDWGSSDGDSSPSRYNTVMFKRWAIRGVLVGLLLLCLGGWGWSWVHFNSLSYGHRGYYVACYSKPGRVELVGGYSQAVTEEGWEWVGYHRKYYGSYDLWFMAQVPPIIGKPRNMVFADEWTWNVSVPYWILSGVFFLALLYVWRKTRHKLSAATAFPVETTGGQP